MRRSTHASQRGFVPGRLLVQNVLDLDAAARIQGMKPAIRHGGKSDRLAALALWDHAAAFPSMSHNWNLHVLAQRKFPIGSQNFVRLILFFATASADQRTLTEYFFHFSYIYPESYKDALPARSSLTSASTPSLQHSNTTSQIEGAASSELALMT